ncbi:hypothetical protein D9M72_542860 [compost metagenome]
MALLSIWRIRSRVTSNCLPTSSSVWSLAMSMPKRMRSTLASRGVSSSSISRTTARRPACRAASAGVALSESAIMSPRLVSPSSPTGVSIDTGSLAIFMIERIFSSGMSMRSASTAGSGSLPVCCMISRDRRLSLLICSIMCTGTRMVRAWSAMARVTAWRTHQVA